MSSIYDRTELLLGKDALESLKDKKVAIFGLGGVGGTAFEALVRTGVGTIHAIDRDVVDASNLNRQIIYTQEDVGKSKSDCAARMALCINPAIKVVSESYSVNAGELVARDYSSFDYLIDAMDDIAAKIALIEYSSSHSVPLIVSLGMANRLDPSKVQIVSLAETYNDPFAKKLRTELRKRGINLKKIECVASSELPFVRKIKPASMMMVPSEAGLLICYRVIGSLANLSVK
jgi:tRNA threonylcarbamoyladenosine dehydratase